MTTIDSKLPLVQDAELKDKVVLVRVDHNVVKNGKIEDAYRIDRTIATMYNIVEKGGRILLATHVGRPKDKATGEIRCDAKTSTDVIAQYLERKLRTKIAVAAFRPEPKRGIVEVDASIKRAIRSLRCGEIGAIYLPNTRWFEGEEVKGELRDIFARQLAGLAEVYVNDAIGSWQPHASTYDVTKYLPSYAGLLMQDEISHLSRVLNPERPFLSVIAGAKYDTKISTLSALFKKVDYLLLGGVIYNAYLCAKYNVRMSGVPESDISAAQELVALDRAQKKIVELPYIIESDLPDQKVEGKYRTINIKKFEPGKSYGYVLDVDPMSFNDARVLEIISSAKTIFVNAVMGFTPHFSDGSQALDIAIDRNKTAWKLFGGGDTLQEFKNLCPGLYLSVLDDARYYFFTGGGSVLKAIEQNDAYGLEPVKALINNKQNNKDR